MGHKIYFIRRCVELNYQQERNVALMTKSELVVEVILMLLIHFVNWVVKGAVWKECQRITCSLNCSLNWRNVTQSPGTPEIALRANFETSFCSFLNNKIFLFVDNLLFWENIVRPTCYFYCCIFTTKRGKKERLTNFIISRAMNSRT